MKALAQVLDAVGADGQTLHQLVTDMAGLSTRLVNRQGDLVNTVQGLDTSMSAVAQQTSSLSQGINQLPSTLTQAQATLDQVPGTTAAALPLLSDLRTTTNRPAGLLRQAPARPPRSCSRCPQKLVPTFIGLDNLLHFTPALNNSLNATVPQVTQAATELQSDATTGAVSFLRPYTPELAGFLTNWGNTFSQLRQHRAPGPVDAVGAPPPEHQLHRARLGLERAPSRLPAIGSRAAPSTPPATPGSAGRSGRRRRKRGPMSLVATGKDRLYTVIAIVVVAAAVAFGYFIITKPDGGHTIYARFADAQFLVPGNTVHVDGVTAGKVPAQSRTTRPSSSCRLSKSEWPIHRDATAMVRPVTILGEEYVDLNGGTPSLPRCRREPPSVAPSGRPRHNSSTNLQTRPRLRDRPDVHRPRGDGHLSGQRCQGPGRQRAKCHPGPRPRLYQHQRAAQAARQPEPVLTQMIDNVTPVLHSLDTNQGTTLDHLLTTTNNLLSATATSSQQHGHRHPPAARHPRAATSAFNQLGALSDQATPALASLTPLTDNLQGVSQELLNFSAAAQPAAISLQPLLTQTKTLVDKALPVVDTLKAKARWASDLQNLQPILHGNVHNSAWTPTALNNLFSFMPSGRPPPATTTAPVTTSASTPRATAPCCNLSAQARDGGTHRRRPRSPGRRPGSQSRQLLPPAAKPATTNPG